jgi:hypothetical protein
MLSGLVAVLPACRCLDRRDAMVMGTFCRLEIGDTAAIQQVGNLRYEEGPDFVNHPAF